MPKKPNKPSFSTDFQSFTKDGTKGADIIQRFQKEPTDDHKKEALKYLQPTISSALRSFAQGDKTLKTRANIMALKAAKDYRKGKGASPRTYVYNRLQKLIRYKSDRDETVHIPERSRLMHKKIMDFERDFKNTRNRPPSDIEVSDGLAASLRDIKKARRYGQEVPSSAVKGEKGEAPGIQERSELDIAKDYVYYDLDDINRKIFEWNTGYGGTEPIPKKKQAEQLNLSPAAVSQRINTIQKRIQDIINE